MSTRDGSRHDILSQGPRAPTDSPRVALPTRTPLYADPAAPRGAAPTAEPIVDAKARFEAAAEKLRTAVKANAGLRVLAASASPDVFYASNPAISTDLMYFTELGLNVVVPDKLDTGGYFESLSWENADKYRAGLILLDNRTIALQPKDLAAKPGWGALPAVKANQVTPWDTVPRFSYAGSAPLLERLAEAVQNAKKVA